jgi:hypothetical protein
MIHPYLILKYIYDRLFCFFFQNFVFFSSIKKLDESTSMLSVTCDAFIHTLDECVKLATGNSSQSLLLLSPSPTIVVDESTINRKSISEFEQTKFVQNEYFNLNRIVFYFRSTTNLPKQIVYETFFSQLSLK